MALGRIWADGVWDEGIWDNAIWAQAVTFALTSAQITNGGDSLQLGFTEAVTFGAGGNGGFATTFSGGACTLTYDSGDGNQSLIYSTSRTVADGETGTLAYTQPTNGVETAGDGTDLDSFSGFVVNIPSATNIRSVNRDVKNSITGSINQ